jgi:four helix bundle protein
MEKIQSFTQLNVWKISHQLVLSIYQATQQFPSHELYGLTNQIRRCAVSITSNISEGFTRQTRKEKLQFYYISLGSLAELQNQLLIARDLKYIKNDSFLSFAYKTVEIRKLLNGIIKSAQTK